MDHPRATLVLFFLALLGMVGCAFLRPEPGTPQVSVEQVLQQAFAIVEPVGDAVIRVKGYAALQKHCKEAIPLIDTDNDKVITLAEVKAAGHLLLEQPELVAGLLAAAYMLRKG